LDSESAETHTAIAWIKLLHEWDWPAAREHAPASPAVESQFPGRRTQYMRVILKTAGNLDEALNHRKQALALDPYPGRPGRAAAGGVHFSARDYQSTVASARRTVANDANSVTGA